MNRRSFLVFGLTVVAGTTWPHEGLAGGLKKFLFKIKTKSGSIVGNILIEAKDMFAAVAKLKKRYPGCEILEGREK